MNRNIVRIAITAIVALALVISIIPATAPARVLAAAGDVPNRLMLVYYGLYDDAPESTVTILRNAQPKYLVVNTANGYWKNIPIFPTNQISTFQTDYGINIIGYTDCNYNTRDINLVLGEIQKMADDDGVKGVFIDRGGANVGESKYMEPAERRYYQQITALAQSKKLIIWANLGVDDFDPWFLSPDAGFDFIGSTELWDNAALTDVQKQGRNKITVLRHFGPGTLPQITSAQDAYNLTQAAWQKGLAFSYISDNVSWNLPAYFSDYTDMLWNVPVVDTSAASAGSTSATLGGNLIDKRGASSVTVSFEWGTTNDYGNTTSTQSLSSNGIFTQTISNLTANTKYYFRAKAVSGSYTNWGSEGWFLTTPPPVSPPPEVVNNLTVNTAMTTSKSISVNWTAPHEDWNDVNSGPAAQYDVRYSTSTITSGNWNEAHPVTGEPAPGNPGVTDTFTISGLNPSTTYYIALKTTDTKPDNWSGLSNVVSGTTNEASGLKPEVITQPATLVTSTTANLNGNLLSLGDSAVVSLSFLYDDDQSGEYDFVQVLDPVSTTGEFSLTVSNLIPQTTYFFKARAVNEHGEDLGSELSFDTRSPNQEIIKSIEAGADDGFSGTWAFSNTATWYEAGSPGSGATYGAWFRFRNVDIPYGAIIDEAYLTLLQTQWDANTHLKIRAEDTANPSAPADTSDHASRSRTSTGVDWDAGYGDYNWHASPDLAGVIQELVNSYDYSGGSSAIQILIDDDSSSASDEHIGQTYEANTAPQLHITYHVVPNVIDRAVASGVDDGSVVPGHTPIIRPGTRREARPPGERTVPGSGLPTSRSPRVR